MSIIIKINFKFFFDSYLVFSDAAGTFFRRYHVHRAQGFYIAEVAETWARGIRQMTGLMSVDVFMDSASVLIPFDSGLHTMTPSESAAETGRSVLIVFRAKR